MKHTAVGWIIMQWMTQGTLFDSDMTKAEEMEKQQIMQALNDGKEMAILHDLNKSIEQYYKETYVHDTKGKG